ncbi:hypothetical protein ABT297_11225 [Dactylosporangium sp. NPDC000555]|uniref:hypothetical protein n=1 Tax=Dactylosporangium sp. NPDC000555 TaxID=3154260 RepID=UPI003330F34E
MSVTTSVPPGGPAPGGLTTGAIPTPPFTHPPMTARPPMNDTTRRLCAAAYLDDEYAYRVIQETTGDDQRAVPPSLGFDIEPVIRHSFRARGMLLSRDGILSAILLATFVLLPIVTIGWLCFAWGVRQIRLVHRLRREVLSGQVTGALATRIGALRTNGAWAAVLLSAVLYACGFSFSPLFLLSPQEPVTSQYYGQEPDTVTTLTQRLVAAFDTSLSLLILALPLLFALVTVGYALIARVRTFRTLISVLAPGANAPLPGLPSTRVERRVGWLAAAQRGNVSLHSKRPFMGAGDTAMVWSMAVLLQGRAVRAGAGRHDDTERFDRDGTFDPGSVSALRLQQSVHEAVLRLQDAALPAHQRVPGVYVMDRIIADGERYQGDPLIDPRSRTALQLASADAVAAIVEQPQGGVRHYLHVLVGVDGREVRLRDGRVAVPPQSQDIVISAHVHVAVEGGKLYVEFIGTVLPPIRDEFKIIDRLRPDLGHMIGRALPGLMSDWMNSFDAPRRLLRWLRQMISINQRARQAHEDALVFKSYDHGARLCVRELAAESQVRTFLQDLDAGKYLKLVEKTVLATVLDYLERAGVDTSEYRMQMNHIQNFSNTFSSATFNGPAAFGAGALAQSVGAQQAGVPV